MIKLDLGTLIVAYIGFVVPIFIMQKPHDALMIAFFLFFWTLTLCLWTNWIKP